MAFVVARHGGRFEVRESLYTSRGPRSRTLAGFAVLSEDVLAAAARRAQRPFDADAVIRSARRAGARVSAVRSGAERARDRFLAGSRRMATITAGMPPPRSFGPGAGRSGDAAGGWGVESAGARGDAAADLHAGVDAGATLRELLGFADLVRAGQPPSPPERLEFPPLARLAERRPSLSDTRGR